jgi:hypothetical protein
MSGPGPELIEKSSEVKVVLEVLGSICAKFAAFLMKTVI